MDFSPLKFRDRAGCTVVRAPSGVLVPVSRLVIGGIFTVRCFTPCGRLRWQDIAPNMIVSGGLDLTLNSTLRGQSQIATWYMGLVDNAGFTNFATGDTMLSHPGWAESTAYNLATRPVWTAGPPASNTVVNGTTSDFVMSAPGTMRGMFIVSLSDKGGTDGTLFSEAAYSQGNQNVGTGDTLKCTYQVSASST
jgi:hypothetical protein